MGTKFGNLHIKTNDKAKVLEALQKLTENSAGRFCDISSIFGSLDIIDQYVYRSNLLNKQEELKSENLKASFYVAQNHKDWVSVLNDHFEWGSVKQAGEILSQYLEEPILTIGFFDEDIFECSMYQNGEIQAEQIFCEEWAREEYALEEERLDFEYMKMVLQINNESLDKLVLIKNPERAVEELTDLTGLHLWMHADWIQYEADLQKIFHKHEFEAH